MPRVAVTTLVLVALALRLPALGDSLAGDEVSTLYDVHVGGLGDLLALLRDGTRASNEYSPPGYFALAWVGAQVTDAYAALRIPSLLASVALVPVLAALGREVAGVRAGLVAAAAGALAPFAIFYGTEARPYALLMLCSAGATLALLRALRADGGRRWWIAYAVLTAGILYSHYTGAALVVAQAAWALTAATGRRRAVLAANAGALALYAPWLPFVRTEETLGIYVAIGPKTLADYARTVAQVLPGNPFLSPGALPGRAALLLLALVLAGCAAWVLARRGRALARGWRSPLGLVALLALATPLGLLVLGRLSGGAIFLPRSLAASLPAALVGLAALVAAVPRRPGVVAAAVLVGVLGVGALQSLERANRRPDFEGMARFVDAEARPGEPVVNAIFGTPDAAASRFLSINFARPHPERFLGIDDRAAWAHAAARPGRRVFLVIPQFGAFPRLVRPPGGGARFAEVGRRRATGFLRFDVVVYASR